MVISSFLFLALLIPAVAVHWLLPSRLRGAWLLVLSIAFCMYSAPWQTVVMLVYILLVFAAALRLFGKRHIGKLCFMILISVGLLLLYKYAGTALAAVSGGRLTLKLLAPVGISYITFQCIAYMTEVYRGNIPAERNAVRMLLYCMLFTKVTAGPIEMPGKLLPQLEGERKFSYEMCMEGTVLIITGLAKKRIIADMLVAGVGAVFDDPSAGNGWSAILGACMYALQIYCDFSGYTDIARGASRLFGIELSENFDHPYSALTVKDFWRRWHISLSEWLKNYIYFPLGGSRCSAARRSFNLIITFLVSGIWHGAGLTFIVWGLLHGLYQVIGNTVSPMFSKLRSRIGDKLPYKIFARVRTFFFVTVAWVFFRADSLGSAFTLLAKPFKNMGSLGDAVGICGLNLPMLLLIAVAYAASELAKKRFLTPDGHGVTRAARSPVQVFVFALIMLWAVLLAASMISGESSAFIYMDF